MQHRFMFQQGERNLFQSDDVTMFECSTRTGGSSSTASSVHHLSDLINYTSDLADLQSYSSRQRRRRRLFKSGSSPVRLSLDDIHPCLSRGLINRDTHPPSLQDLRYPPQCHTNCRCFNLLQSEQTIDRTDKESKAIYPDALKDSLVRQKTASQNAVGHRVAKSWRFPAKSSSLPEREFRSFLDSSDSSDSSDPCPAQSSTRNHHFRIRNDGRRDNGQSHDKNERMTVSGSTSCSLFMKQKTTSLDHTNRKYSSRSTLSNQLQPTDDNQHGLSTSQSSLSLSSYPISRSLTLPAQSSSHMWPLKKRPALLSGSSASLKNTLCGQDQPRYGRTSDVLLSSTHCLHTPNLVCTMTACALRDEAPPATYELISEDLSSATRVRVKEVVDSSLKLKSKCELMCRPRRVKRCAIPYSGQLHQNNESGDSIQDAKEIRSSQTTRILEGKTDCGACSHCDDVCDDVACTGCSVKKLKLFRKFQYGMRVRKTTELLCETRVARMTRAAHESMKAERQFTPCEVRRHASPQDCWLMSHGIVYNATPFLTDHPAGPDCILRKAGQDVTRDFDFHSTASHKIWKNLMVGTVLPCTGYPGSEYLAYSKFNAFIDRFKSVANPCTIS